jgi:ubiquitin C-terminal hydrolase
MYRDNNNYYYYHHIPSNSGFYGNQYSNNSSVYNYDENYPNFNSTNTEDNKYTNYTNYLKDKNNNKTFEKYNMKDYQNKGINLCKIKNYGNNCYLNSGLQILVSCKIFVEELKKYNTKSVLTNLTKQAIHKLLNEKNYEPKEFLIYFSRINNQFPLVQSCSQNFIRTLLKNLNNELILTNENLIVENEQYKPKSGNENYKYRSFIISNNIFPESSLLSIFSGMTKSHSKSICKYCNESIEEFSFCYFIDQNMYLDNNKYTCNFSDVLEKNFEKNNLIMNCPKCSREINMNEETKFIKLPEILIFTLERFEGEYNKVEIKPDEYIDMRNYVDAFDFRTKYELIAINIRLGEQKNFGHEICQVKRQGKWFELNDEIVNEKIKSYNNYSYGLFYQRL